MNYDRFWRDSPLSMDPLRGPDEQYRAGARDMLCVVVKVLQAECDAQTHINTDNANAMHYALDVMKRELGEH